MEKRNENPNIQIPLISFSFKNKKFYLSVSLKPGNGLNNFDEIIVVYLSDSSNGFDPHGPRKWRCV